MTKDYYSTLGLNNGASTEEIKKAYKTLAKQYHPDLNREKGSADKFKEINEAYATLGDDSKRANYDRFGTAEEFTGFQDGFQGFNFDDIFEDFFGGGIFGNSRKRRGRGADIQYQMELDFIEAAFGTKKDIELTRYENCGKCNGTGAEELETCEDCNGKGRRRNTIRTPFGMIAQTAACQRCRGTGQMAAKECKSCKGEGRKRARKTVTVKVPAGVDTGSTLRVTGEGEAGESGPGDMYVEISVNPHDTFERDGNNVLLTVPISFPQAALGTEVEIPTLEGKSTIKIPAGMQTHTVLRMRGKGIADVHTGSRGDQLVKIVLKTPTALTRRQREILAELADKEEKPKPEKDFFTKFKEKFI